MKVRKKAIMFVGFVVIALSYFGIMLFLDMNSGVEIEEDYVSYVVGVNSKGKPICFKGILTAEEFDAQQILWEDMFGYRNLRCN